MYAPPGLALPCVRRVRAWPICCSSRVLFEAEVVVLVREAAQAGVPEGVGPSLDTRNQRLDPARREILRHGWWGRSGPNFSHSEIPKSLTVLFEIRGRVVEDFVLL